MSLNSNTHLKSAHYKRAPPQFLMMYLLIDEKHEGVLLFTLRDTIV